MLRDVNEDRKKEILEEFLKKDSDIILILPGGYVTKDGLMHEW